jgi:4-aminobutyrate aminotransferase
MKCFSTVDWRRKMPDFLSNPEYMALVARVGKTVAPALHRYTPLAVNRGQGAYLYDILGNKYLDFAAGMASLPLGHCHPKVIAAIKEQAEEIHHIFNHIGYYRPYVELMETLQSVMPPGLTDGMGILMNSGSEAIESTLKAARFVTGRPVIISFINSFHGRSLGALSVTNSKSLYRKHHNSLLNGAYYVPYPFSYRFLGKRVTDDEALRACKAFMKEVLDKIVTPEEVAAIIVEPIQGEGGYRIPPMEFLPYLRKLCDEIGCLLIVDEIQTGLGRTGRMFGFEHSDIVPDLIALAKAFGGGLPLSCAFGNRDVMAKWSPGSQGSTFGGNPIAIAASIATFAIIKEERLVENANTIGKYLIERLKGGLAGKSCIGDIRGKGLLIGVELIDENGDPAVQLSKTFCSKAVEKGLVITTCGESTLRFAPALIIGEKEAEEAVHKVCMVLSELGY